MRELNSACLFNRIGTRLIKVMHSHNRIIKKKCGFRWWWRDVPSLQVRRLAQCGCFQVCDTCCMCIHQGGIIYSEDGTGLYAYGYVQSPSLSLRLPHYHPQQTHIGLSSTIRAAPATQRHFLVFTYPSTVD